MSEQYEEQNTDSSGQDQTEGGGEGGTGEENNEADMIFAPEASKPGRNAGMLMIAFVLIGVGVIYFMRARAGGPAPVSAEALKAKTLIDGFDSNQVRKMKDLLEKTQTVVDDFNKDRNLGQDDKKLEYNPFTYHSPNEKPGETDAEKIERDRKKNLEKRRAAFTQDIGNLRVQYIMVSNFAKTAMINNKLVQEGQEVEGFTIEKLSPTSVIVQRDGLRASITPNKEMK
jgi:hypothetical protein